MDTKKDPFQNLQERMRNALADHSIRAFQELSSSTRDLMSCYRCAIMEIETKFRVLNERFSLQHDRNPIDSIQSRLKSPDSILDKMLRKSCPLPSRQLKTTSSTSQASVSSAPLWTIFTCSPTACCSRTISR